MNTQNHKTFAIGLQHLAMFYFLAVPLLIGVVVGGGLAILFCGMSLVFLFRKQQQNGEAKANGPNANERIKTGTIKDKS